MSLPSVSSASELTYRGINALNVCDVEHVINNLRAQGMTELYTSYGEGPGSLEAFYKRLGFVPTGGTVGEDEVEVYSRPSDTQSGTHLADGKLRILLFCQTWIKEAYSLPSSLPATEWVERALSTVRHYVATTTVHRKTEGGRASLNSSNHRSRIRTVIPSSGISEQFPNQLVAGHCISTSLLRLWGKCCELPGQIGLVDKPSALYNVDLARFCFCFSLARTSFARTVALCIGL